MAIGEEAARVSQLISVLNAFVVRDLAVDTLLLRATAEAILKPDSTDNRYLVGPQDALQLRLRGEGGSAENTHRGCN